MNDTRWIAMHCGEETAALQENYPNAFLLLAQIARRARWRDCPITGLKTGEAFIGDWRKAGLPSKKAYEVAKHRLEKCQLVTFKGGNRGTRAFLVSTAIFSLSEDDRGKPAENPTGSKGEPNGKQGGSTQTDTQNTQNTQIELPLEGGTCQERFLPKGWKELTKEQRNRLQVNANSPAMKIIGGFFNRRPSTLWYISEAVALLELKPTEDEVDLLARYYAKAIDKENDFRRRDLPTLLNNWPAEVDRARTYNAATSES